LKRLIRLLLKILIITLVTVVSNTLLGLIFRWQTTVQFSNGLFWAAVVLAGLGILSAFGVKEVRLYTGSKFYRSSQQERQTGLEDAEDPNTQAKQSKILTGQSFNTYIILFLSAVLILLVGYLVTVIFPAS
jgi:hypothetical protein